MVFAARIIVIGGTRYTPQEAQFLRAAVRSGLTRGATRSFMRETFQRGLPNSAFAGFRTSITEGERAGIAMIRARPGARIIAENFQAVTVVRSTASTVISTTVRVRFPRTGTFRDIAIRAGFKETPDEATFQRRVRDIINRGHQGESAVQIEGELRDDEHPRTVTFQSEIR